MYKNNEGYADPTSGAAIKEATWMPHEVHKVYKMLQAAAKAAGMEITGIRDRNGKEWKR